MPSKKTDFPDNPFKAETLDKAVKLESAAQYAAKQKPYQPLPEGEHIPSMSTLWSYAHRRYGRYQGYAWAGVVAVGGVTALTYVMQDKSTTTKN
mmetsp:Transcript_7084/g.8164  ORF Transcript_7084/g.8164 Transcript_7084/m.8164 type:complete len:94 (+) Transcript_7084:93-374(+)